MERAGGERKNKSIDHLAETLGFTESPEALALRQEYTQALREGSERVGELARAYHMLGEEWVDTQPSTEQATSARVGLNIAMALILRDAGHKDEYYDDLWDILQDVEGLISGGKETFIGISNQLHQVLEDADD